MSKQLGVIFIFISIAILSAVLGYFISNSYTATAPGTIVIEQEENGSLINSNLPTPPPSLEGYTPPTTPPSDEEWESSQSTTSVPNADDSDILAKLRTIFAQIEAETQLTASNLTQCKLLPLGHSLCGGPGFYHVYSSVGSNEPRLLELATEHRTLAQQFNQTNDLAGICVITPEPEIEIVDGICTDDF